ncbi:hypothetical protein T459_11346 [Capsicum annuum]|uniref:Uncharacterized protein n=1 Tax=Capsicum annuum TaxID=4072 RepID=A0A2G2ZLR2_CAPAN|nr:hypothetical protein T459_11346 [Capsicum annuum]
MGELFTSRGNGHHRCQLANINWQLLTKELDVVASIIKMALDCCAESLARWTNMKDVVECYRRPRFKFLDVEHVVPNDLFIANF